MKWVEKLKAKLGLAADVEITEAHIEAIALAVDNSENDAKAGLLDTVLAGVQLAATDKDETTAIALSGSGKDVTLPETFKPEEHVLVNKEAFNSLRAQVTALSAEAEVGKKYLKAKREECIRLYKLSMDGKGAESVIKLMENADSDTLDGLMAQYTKGLSKKFTVQLKEDGSIEFRSSLEDSKDDSKEKNETNAVAAPVSFEDMYSKYDKGMSRRSK